MILVTGSTGLIGRHLIYSLAHSGNAIKALYRSVDKKKQVEDYFAFAKAQHLLPQIQWAQGDITDVPRLSEIFMGVTHVIHCAALISFNPYDFKALSKINIEGTANVVNLCLSNRIKKLIHVSSIATLSNLPHTPITEENYWDPDLNNSVYALTKYGAEMEVWRGTQEGLNALIFNPGIILGEGDYTSTSGGLIQYVLKEKSFFPTGSAAVIDVKDLVALLILGMRSSHRSERYISVSHHLEYKKLFDQMAGVLEKESPQHPLQHWWIPFLIFIDWTQGLFSGRRKMTKTSFTALQTKRTYSTQKLANTFSLKPTPLERTLERIATHVKSGL